MKGFRTIITGWVETLSVIGLIIGININPEVVVDWIINFKDVLITLFAILGSAVHVFRNLANDDHQESVKNNQPIDEGEPINLRETFHD